MLTDLTMPIPVPRAAARERSASDPSTTDVATAHSVRFDVMRVSACLAVILLHLAATIVVQPDLAGTLGWHISNLLDSATRWCVPVFVMLSGALLLDAKRYTNEREFWTRRVSRLLPALLAWSAIYFAWRAFFWKEPLSWGVISHDLIAGRPFIHLYFLFLIAGLYLVTPFLAKAIENLSPSQLGRGIVTIALLAMGANLFDFLASSAFTMFVPYLAYYLAGWYLARVLPARPYPYGLIAAAAAACVAALTVLTVSIYGFTNRWSFYFYEDFSPFVMVMAVTVFLFIQQGQIHPAVATVAQRLAPWTLGVYVAHPIVVELLRYAYYKSAPLLLLPPYYVPVTLTMTCLLTFGLVALLQNIPGARRIV